MTIRFRYDLEDYVDATIVAYRELYPYFQRQRLGAILVGLAIVPLVLWTHTLPPPNDSISYWMMPLGLWIAWHFGSSTPTRKARKVYKPLLKDEEYEADISEVGITTVSPTIRTEMQWAAFDRVLEGETTFTAYTGAVMYVFPKCAFTAAEIEQFRNLIGEKVKSA
jgi:hypothetical protein